MASDNAKSKTDPCEAARRQLGPEKDAAWFGFMRAHSLVTKALDSNLVAGFGIQLSGFEVLSRLENADEQRLRMTDLAKEVQLSQSRISRLVAELESDGLLERQSCPTDNRVVYATTTGKGRELLRKIEDQHFEAIDSHFFQGLSKTEIKQLGAMWPRIIESAQARSVAAR